MQTALLEANDDTSRAREVLADFYFHHDLGISAHRVLRSPADDPKLLDLASEIFASKSTSSEMKVFALQTLSRSDKLSSTELKNILHQNPDPTLVLSAAKQLAFKGLLKKDDCQKLSRTARTVSEQSSSYMTVAFWHSDLNEPIPTECLKLGISVGN